MHVPGSAQAADGADSLVFAHAVQPAPGVLRAITQPDPVDQGTEDGWSRVAYYQWCLRMRLTGAGLHQRRTKALYPYHRLTPSLTEDATRDRSNRLLGVNAPSYASILLRIS